MAYQSQYDNKLAVESMLDKSRVMQSVTKSTLFSSLGKYRVSFIHLTVNLFRPLTLIEHGQSNTDNKYKIRCHTFD